MGTITTAVSAKARRTIRATVTTQTPRVRGRCVRERGRRRWGVLGGVAAGVAGPAHHQQAQAPQAGGQGDAGQPPDQQVDAAAGRFEQDPIAVALLEEGQDLGLAASLLELGANGLAHLDRDGGVGVADRFGHAGGATQLARDLEHARLELHLAPAGGLGPSGARQEQQRREQRDEQRRGAARDAGGGHEAVISAIFSSSRERSTGPVCLYIRVPSARTKKVSGTPNRP